jgi:type III pantothenate kinase
MNLVIDVGNTAVKVGVFKDNTLLFSETYLPSNIVGLLNNLENFPIDTALLSAVSLVDPQLLNFLNGLNRFFRLDTNSPLPIKNNYQTPSTLGADRLSNAVGASFLYPSKPVLVIDAGTCLKFDFVHPTDGYLGGSISPGLQMRYKSLNHYTAALPLLEPIEFVDLIGNDTKSSIHSGIINGMISEIDGIIGQYLHIFPDLVVVITGGDHHFFLNRLKTHIFAAPNLTLIGLEVILRNSK